MEPTKLEIMLGAAMRGLGTELSPRKYYDHAKVAARVDDVYERRFPSKGVEMIIAGIQLHSGEAFTEDQYDVAVATPYTFRRRALFAQFGIEYKTFADSSYPEHIVIYHNKSGELTTRDLEYGSRFRQNIIPIIVFFIKPNGYIKVTNLEEGDYPLYARSLQQLERKFQRKTIPAIQLIKAIVDFLKKNQTQQH
ncbi:hypothetical protein HYX02_04075 [Candidatus Woesearchaeota archaeon]|nr:hypothetical protein [Candidatus Woesearchaeota archaeon]